MPSEEPTRHHVLAYESPTAKYAGGKRTGGRVLCVLLAIAGLLTLILGSVMILLVVVLNPAGDQSEMFFGASVYLTIAAVCLIVAFRWGRSAFPKRPAIRSGEAA